MYKQFFAGMEWTALPIFALCLFMGFFTLVVIRTFAFKTRQDFEPDSALPLFDGIPERAGGAQRSAANDQKGAIK